MRMSTTDELETHHTTTHTDAPSPSSSPSSPQSLVASGQSLSSQLMDDILDPNNTPIHICKIHGLTLQQLADIMQSAPYKRAAAQIRAINTERADLIAHNDALKSRALHREIAKAAYIAACDIDELAATRDPKLAATKSRYLETARKANSKLFPSPGGPARRAGSPPSPPTSRDRKGPVPSPPSPAAAPRVPQFDPPHADKPCPPKTIGVQPPKQPRPTHLPRASGEDAEPPRGGGGPPPLSP